MNTAVLADGLPVEDFYSHKAPVAVPVNKEEPFALNPVLLDTDVDDLLERGSHYWDATSMAPLTQTSEVRLLLGRRKLHAVFPEAVPH